MCLEKRNSVQINVHIKVVCFPFFFFFFALFNNSTFEECYALIDCFINSEEGEGFFFAITIRLAE